MFTSLTAALLIAFTQSPSASWVVAGGTADQETVIFMDIGTLRKDRAGVRTAWVIMVERERSDLGYDYVTMRKQYRCADGDMRLNYMAIYRLGENAPFDSGAITEPWEPALPSSSAENEMETACSDEARPGFSGSSYDIAQIGRDVLTER